MIHYYGVEFGCDVCGVRATTDDRPAKMSWDDPLPEGWASMRASSIMFKDSYGTPLTHFCPDCRKLDWGQLEDKIREQMKAAR